jgi:hypothetical protein
MPLQQKLSTTAALSSALDTTYRVYRVMAAMRMTSTR